MLLSLGIASALLLAIELLPDRSVQAQNVPIASLEDIACDGSAHAINSSSGSRWLQIIALSTNTGTIRIGDSNVSATRGAPVAPGGGLFLSLGNGIAINSVYYYCTASDKLSVIWGN